MPILAILFTWGAGSSPQNQGGRLWAQRGPILGKPSTTPTLERQQINLFE